MWCNKIIRGCKKNSTRAEEKKRTVARTKQHEEEEEEDTGVRPARRESKGRKRETRATKKENETRKAKGVIAAAFTLPPLNPTKTQWVKTTPHCCRVHGYAINSINSINSSTRHTY